MYLFFMKVNNFALHNEQNKMKYKYVCLKALPKETIEIKNENTHMLRTFNLFQSSPSPVSFSL
jgi:hypothetical protein